MKKKLPEQKLKKLFSILCLLLIVHLNALAQTHRITGRVTADDNSPLIGVTVRIKGGTVGVPTDVKGTYYINAKVGDVLVFSYVSYQTKEVTVGDNPTINVTLSNSSSNLNEVVVIGYGTSKRGNLATSVGSISSKDIAIAQPTTFDQALQGRVAGVMVQTSSGQPGGAISVLVRGLGTFGNASPLYVIDGVIVPPGNQSSTGGVFLGNNPITDNPLSTINPSDIASIDVLKDAAAIAIYGSQGSAGVVIITTKRGKVGPPKINFDGYYGVQKVTKQIPMLDLQQYAEFLDTKAAIQGGVILPGFANPEYLGAGTNWENELFKSSGTYSANLSVSGGDARTTYLISGNYFNQDGIIIGSNFKRESFKVSLDNKTNDWLRLGTNLTISGINENVNSSQYDVIDAAYNLTPDIATKNPDGSISFPVGFQGSYNPNPIAAAALNTNQIERLQIFGNIYADILFTKDLTLHNELTEWFDYGNVNQFFPSLTINTSQTQSSAYVNSANNKSYTFRNQLTYNHTLPNDFNVNVMAAHEATAGVYTYLSGGRTNFVANDPQGLSLGSTTSATNSGGTSNNANESYLGRASLNYQGKYLLQASVRDDGNSNFAAGHRWVTTYGLAGAWDAGKENFLKNDIADQIKFRASYGLTNNANIPQYQYGAAIALQTVGLGEGAQPENIANPLLQWETSKEVNLGLDLGFLKDRIQFTVDAFLRKTNNLLQTDPLPLYSGDTGTGYLGAPTVNVGSIQNKGLEFSLNTRNISGTHFTWSTTITATLLNTKILSLVSNDAFITGIIDNGAVTATRSAVGGDIGEFYGYIAEGVYKNGADLANSAKPAGVAVAPNGTWVGDVKYKDLNHDGVIDQNDQTYLGSPTPKVQYGINNTFTYGNFDMTVFFNGNYGNKILNYELVKHGDPNGGANYFSSVLNYARLGLVNPNGSATDPNNVYVINANTSVPAIRTSGDPNTAISSNDIESGSYLRLKNLQIGYKLPVAWLNKWKVSSLRVYVSSTNLFTITKYTGLDPEVGDPLISSKGGGAEVTGIDYGHYPNPRFFTFGFNVGL
jgi:TonB-linked SusC/RagA family outer membrane protein